MRSYAEWAVIDRFPFTVILHIGKLPKSSVDFKNNSGKALIARCQNTNGKRKHDKTVSLRLPNTCEYCDIASSNVSQTSAVEFNCENFQIP